VRGLIRLDLAGRSSLVGASGTPDAAVAISLRPAAAVGATLLPRTNCRIPTAALTLHCSRPLARITPAILTATRHSTTPEQSTPGASSPPCAAEDPDDPCQVAGAR
jgi:hypothetical protein